MTADAGEIRAAGSYCDEISPRHAQFMAVALIGIDPDKLSKKVSGRPPSVMLS
jgi:hypothetical protein